MGINFHLVNEKRMSFIKRNILLFFTLLTILICVFIGSVSAKAETGDTIPDFKIADVIADGIIAANDARTALRISAGLEKPTDIQAYAADIDGDGLITATDARYILRISAGLSSVPEDVTYDFDWHDSKGNKQHASGFYRCDVDAVDAFRQVNRVSIDYTIGFARYIDHEVCKATVDRFVKVLKTDLKSKGFTDTDVLLWLIAFVQNTVIYESDGEDIEYPKFPYETMYDQAGDCEDSAILVITFLRAAGYDTVMILFEDHAMAGIALDESEAATVMKATFKNAALINLNGVSDEYSTYDYEGKTYYPIEATAVVQLGLIPPGYDEANLFPFDAVNPKS